MDITHISFSQQLRWEKDQLLYRNRYMDTTTRAAFAQEICKKTQYGSVTDWTERIAKLGENAGLPMHQIVTGSGSPEYVANNIVREADLQGRMSHLTKAFMEYSPEVKEWSRKTPWQQYRQLSLSNEGMQDYIKAEYIAVQRGIEILRQRGPKNPMVYREFMAEVVEFANSFPGIGAKYRDATIRFETLADYGVLAFDGDPEQWDTTTVRITAKGYLSRPEEWWDERVPEDKDVVFDPERFFGPNRETE